MKFIRKHSNVIIILAISALSVIQSFRIETLNKELEIMRTEVTMEPMQIASDTSTYNTSEVYEL